MSEALREVVDSPRGPTGRHDQEINLVLLEAGGEKMGVWPEPTRDELATLTFHVTEWGDRTREQRAICLAILRGHRAVPDIAMYLKLGERNVELELADLIGNGLRRDKETLLFH